MNTPFFSIIVPTLNSGFHIANCIKSVIKQTYPSFEILVMDGMSKDKTLEIIQSYHDERIRIFAGKDKGIFDAMNKGIGMTKGIWLYFLGSDDELYSNDTLSSIADQCVDGIDVVYANVFSTRFKGLHDGKFDEKKILK